MTTTPSHIGQYRIVRKIGAGGMGMVFLGEHTLLGRRAAIKTLLPTVAVNQELVERFFNEARATSAISDPGVIQVFDFGYHVDGTAYIVMELLEGEALSARLDRLGKLPLPDALRIARQIAGSLAAAHAHDIVHRDLKPENVFLVVDAEAQGGERTKILDFGVCKVGTDASDSSLTQTGAMIGTPVYMSPEQCRGAGGVDHRSDIYACGCLLFHMLTGRPPFVREATGELIVAHMHEEPPAPSEFAELPPEVDAVLARCLAKPVDERYQSMAELQAALGEVYAQLDAYEAPAETVKPAVPLGPGFRSVFDANFAARGSAIGSSPVTRQALPWKRVSPSSFMTSAPEGNETPMPPPRSNLRLILAGVAVLGIVIGLVATSFIVYAGRDDSERTEHVAAHPVALPVEASGADPVAAPAAVGTAAPAPSAVPSAVDASVATGTAPAEPSVSVVNDKPSDTSTHTQSGKPTEAANHASPVVVSSSGTAKPAGTTAHVAASPEKSADTSAGPVVSPAAAPGDSGNSPVVSPDAIKAAGNNNGAGSSPASGSGSATGVAFGNAMTGSASGDDDTASKDSTPGSGSAAGKAGDAVSTDNAAPAPAAAAPAAAVSATSAPAPVETPKPHHEKKSSSRRTPTPPPVAQPQPPAHPVSSPEDLYDGR